VITALVLVACLTPPYFPPDWTGPECTVARQVIECGCSECMTWSRPVDAEWYEILRTNPGGTTQNVGSTRSRNHAGWTDEEGAVYPPIHVTQWCFGWDSQLPVASSLYSYKVRACRAARPNEIADPCSTWSAVSVEYRAAPYTVVTYPPAAP
jgi:hypothetical protein